VNLVRLEGPTIGSEATKLLYMASKKAEKIYMVQSRFEFVDARLYGYCMSTHMHDLRSQAGGRLPYSSHFFIHGRHTISPRSNPIAQTAPFVYSKYAS